MNARLQVMVESRELEEAEAPDREVVARWHKAVVTYRDAGKDLGADSRLTLCYQAALQACTALVRAAGFRVLGKDHHRHTFEAVHALGLGELSSLGRDLSDFRRRRHHAVYDWDDAVPGDPADAAAELDELARTVGRLLALGHTWLAASRPAIAAELDPAPRTSGSG
jgi:hypothetical protein